MKRKCLIFLFLWAAIFVPSVSGQQSRGQQGVNHLDFTGGLNTRYPSNFIADNEAQSALNVLFDNNTLVKRGGQKQQNNTAIGGGDHDILGLYEYKKSNGTDYCVTFSSRTGYYSTDDCATFTAFISTLTVDETVNCAPFQDRLYCVNGTDTAFYFDGTTYTLVTGLPNAKYLRAHQNRLWAAGNTTQKSYIYFSNVGDGNSWDTTLQWVGFNPEDGDVITGIGPPIYEILPVYKKYSAWTVQGNSADNYTPVIVNDSIGANSHRDIRNFLLRNTKTLQLFSSLGIRGGEPGIYSFNGIVIEYLSDKIRDDMRNLDTFHSTERYKQWTSGGDWSAGTSVEIDTFTDVGVIQPKFWTHTDTSATDWAAGTLVNVSTINIVDGVPISTTIGSVTLAAVSSTSLQEYFTDGNSNWAWTVTAGTFDISGGKLRGTTWGYSPPFAPQNNINTPIYMSSGSWKFTYRYEDSTNSACANNTGTNWCFDFRFIKDSSNNFYSIRVVQSGSLDSPIKTVQLVKNYSSSETALISVYSTLNKATNYNWEVIRSSVGVFKVYLNDALLGTATDSNIVACTNINIIAAGLSYSSSLDVYNTFDNIELHELTYKSSGTYTSPIFDTAFSTPIGGPFSFTETVPLGSTLAYSVRESSFNSTDGMGSWNVVSTTTSGEYRIPLTKRYWQYKTDLSTDYSTQTPSIQNISLAATATGYWTSPETLLAADISSWGLLQSAEVITGQANWTYQVRASTYSGGTASASWSAVTNNTTIGISTGAYIQVRPTNSLISSTETAKIDSITVNYKTGASAKSSSGEVYRNRYYWYAQSQNGSKNNIAYIIDSKGAWSKFDNMNVRSTALIKGYMYTGDSLTSAGGFIRRQDIESSDDNATISSSWQSKDYLLGSDDLLKTVDSIYITYPSNPATLTTELYGDGVLARSWNIQLSTSSTFGVKSMSSITTSGQKRAKYFNIKFSNTSFNPWEVLGYRMYWTPLQVLQP